MQAGRMEFERLQRMQRQQEEERQAQERKRHEESKQEELRLRLRREHQVWLANHQAWLAQFLKRQEELAQKEESRRASRRAKAKITKRETNRKEVIIVYNGPDLDQKFFLQHLAALKVVRFKGRIVDAERGTKAVWVMFGRELRRTAIQKAIRKHNLSIDDLSRLKIRL